MVALQAHNVAEATRRLEEAPAELRGWEWEHLRSRLDESVAMFSIGKGNVSAIDVSPDGRCVAAGLDTGKLELWSLETGERLATNPRSKSRCDALRFTPNGKQILLSSFDGESSSRPTTFPNYPSRSPGKPRWRGIQGRPSIGEAGSCCAS